MTGYTANSDGSEPAKSAYLQTSYKLTPVVDPYASKVDMKETVEGWFVPSMPDLNQHNPHLMRYLIQNSIWWIETVGINGIRMDTYPYAYADAMAQWMKELGARRGIPQLQHRGRDLGDRARLYRHLAERLQALGA